MVLFVRNFWLWGSSLAPETHPNVQPKAGVRPAIQEQVHPNLYPPAEDDCRLTYSNGDVQIGVGLELAELLWS